MSKQEANLVLGYLKEQNRPHNAGNLFLNIQKRVGKTNIERILTSNSKDGDVVEKVNGKQAVYWYKQAEDDPNLADNMAKLTKDIQEKKQQAESLKDEVAVLERKKARLVAEPVDTVLKTRIAELDASAFDKRNRLATARGMASSITAADKKQIGKNYDTMTKNWRKRKQVVTNVVGMILDGGYPKKKKNLIEDIGIETDESVQIDIKTFA